MTGSSTGLGARDVVRLSDGELGAYVHVPFCTRICPFCPYNKVVPRGDQPDRYFTALRREIQEYLGAGAGGTRGFTSLYVGGGTPTLYPNELGTLLDLVPVIGERAVEVLPTHATPARLDRLASLGFNAVSIGAQSFSDEVLRHLRRPHDAAAARSAVAAAVDRFDLVDVDLIVDVEFDAGLAGAFLRDFEECLELGVDQVSTYPLMRFGYTPFGRGVHDRRREHAVLAEATRIAHAHGYERGSVWTFLRRSAEGRSQVAYSSITRRRFVGWGAGASSFLGRDFLVNHFGVETYIAAVLAGDLPIARHLRLGAVGGLAYDTFWQAYAGRVQLDALRAAYGPWTRMLSLGLGSLALAGLLRRAGGPDEAPGYVLTRRGYDVYHDLERWVTYRMIEPLWAEMLTEHASEGSSAAWVGSARGRRSMVWDGVSRLLEQRGREGPAEVPPVRRPLR